MQVKMQPTSVIKARLGIEPNGKVQKYFTKRCADYMDKYVPKGDTLLLSEKTTIDSDSITYEMPYAHYQYIGKLYVDPITKKGAFYDDDYGYWSRPGVKKEKTEVDLKQNGYPYWDKKMWSIHEDDIVKEVQDFIDRGGK